MKGATTKVIIVAALALRATPAAAARFAVVVGNDVGADDEPRLRYAETDARRIAGILTSMGEFPPENTALMIGRSASEVRRAIEDAEARLARSRGEGLLLIYYSGHADAEALHLGGGRLPLRELQDIVRDSAVATRVMVVDACRSGALTLTKGARGGGSFDMQIRPASDPHGLAIITSSAAGEESQESEELHASFFTHHLASALVGAGDRDGDGVVTLAEAFSYAARHTTAATAGTWAGPQHPTFKIELGGREDLAMTRPGAAGRTDGRSGANPALGALTLPEPGWYFIRREGDDTLVAEVSSDAVDRPLALAAGRYEVVRRAPEFLLTGTFAVSSATNTAVTEARMRRVDFGRVVRKGGTVRRHAIGVFASGGVRGSLLGLGAATGGGGGARADFRGLSATAALAFTAASTDSTRGTRLETNELQIRGGLLKAFDAATFTVALGAEAGVSRLSQAATDQSLGNSQYALSIGPTAVLELPFARRYFVWLEGALPTYAVDVLDADRQSHERAFHLTYRLGLAAGAYL